MTINERHNDTIRGVLREEADTDSEELNRVGNSDYLLAGSQPNLRNNQSDIGTYYVNNKFPNAVALTSDIQKVLNQVYGIVGGRQLMQSKLAYAPSWLLDREMNDEIDRQ